MQTNKFNNGIRRQYDFDAVERMLLKKSNPPITAAEDESIRERAEALKKEFGGTSQ